MNDEREPDYSESTAIAHQLVGLVLSANTPWRVMRLWGTIRETAWMSWRSAVREEEATGGSPRVYFDPPPRSQWRVTGWGLLAIACGALGVAFDIIGNHRHDAMLVAQSAWLWASFLECVRRFDAS